MNTDEQIGERSTADMAPRNEFDVKKLCGGENYHTWQFAMQNYLELNGLEKCIVAQKDAPNVPEETKAEKLSQAKSRLALSADESLFVHIQKATTALEIWNTFKKMFADNGLVRKIGLLRALISVRLENVGSMQSYVEEIITTSNKLSGIGFHIDDEWLGAVLLAGLTDQFNPLIMSIEGSGIQISADAIKQKLLDNQGDVKEFGQAHLCKQKWKPKTKAIICYSCGGKNHKSVDCLMKSGDSSDQESDSVQPDKQKGTATCAFGIDKKRKMATHNPLGLNASTKTAFMAKHNLLHENLNRGNKQLIEAENIEKSVPVRVPIRKVCIRESIDDVGHNRVKYGNNESSDMRLKKVISNEINQSEVVGCLVNLMKNISLDATFGTNGAQYSGNEYPIGHWEEVKRFLVLMENEVDKRITSNRKTLSAKF